MLLTVKQACSPEEFAVVDNLLKTCSAYCLRKTEEMRQIQDLEHFLWGIT